MSDYVDDMLARYGYPDGLDEEGFNVSEYLTLSDDALRAECAKAKLPLIVSIRKFPRKLSNKQRYCLARWAVERDEREMDREFK